MSFTPGQCRAARALLGWSQESLARACNVAIKTIADFEREERTPYDRTLADIRKALEAEVEFTNGGQPGVRRRPWNIGDKARLRHASRRHSLTIGIEVGEVATIVEVTHHAGDAPWGRLTLQLASGGMINGVEPGHFEHVG